MRSEQDRRVSESLSEGIADDTPILYCKDEGYWDVTFFPTRRDFIDGTNREYIGPMTSAKAHKLAKQRKAKIVVF